MKFNEITEHGYAGSNVFMVDDPVTSRHDVKAIEGFVKEAAQWCFTFFTANRFDIEIIKTENLDLRQTRSGNVRKTVWATKFDVRFVFHHVTDAATFKLRWA